MKRLRFFPFVAVTILFAFLLVSQALAVTLSPGDIIVGNTGGMSIIRVNPVTGAQTTVSSGGSILFPRGVAIVPTPINPIPEPSSLLLLGSGLAGALGYGVRRFRALRSSRQ